VGPGNFISYNVELLDSFSFIPIVEMIPRLGHAHNIVLMILADYGCIGAGALLVICLVCLKRLMAYIRRTGDGFGFALLSGGIVMMFLGLFDVFPLFPSSMGWGGWFMSVMFSLRQGKEPKE
jgi:O-antigen ligase